MQDTIVIIQDQDTKQDTGHVGSGDIMRFNEFTQEDLPFDLAEDLYVFMKNDPEFYRKNYFPVLAGCSDCAKNKKPFDFQKKMMPVIDTAFDAYADKYKLPRRARTVFTDEVKHNVCSMAADEEMETIRKGGY